MRKSWHAYSSAGADLRVDEINPQELVDNPVSIPRGAFLIGNHADELTPWIPAVAAAAGAVGFVNIPCCTWTLEGTRFTNTVIEQGLREKLYVLAGRELSEPLPHPPSPTDPLPASPADRAARALWHVKRCTTSADDACTSKHFAYHAYIARLHLESGWPLETEVLRIPSTKNWAFLARKTI